MVSVGEDGLRTWDLDSGEPLGELSLGNLAARALAIGELNGRPIAVTATSQQHGEWGATVRVWDLVTGVPLGPPLWTDGRVRVLTVAVGERNGRAIAVCGGSDGKLRGWDLATHAPLGVLHCHRSALNAVALTALDGRAVAVTASEDDTLGRWDLETGHAIGEPLKGHRRGVRAVAIGELGGRPVAVSGDAGGVLRRWDLIAGSTIGEPLPAHVMPERLFEWVVGTEAVRAIAVGTLEGRIVAVSAAGDGTLRLWDLATATPIADLTGHVGGVGGVALGELEGRAIVVSAGDDGTVRIWFPLGHPPGGGESSGRRVAVRALATGALNGRAIAVSSGDEFALSVWDLATGDAIFAPLKGHTYPVTAVAVAECEGRTIAVSVGNDSRVIRWELAARPPRGEPLAGVDAGPGGWTSGLAVGELLGRPIVVSGQHDGTIRVWDLATGEPLHAWRTYTVTGFDRGKVESLAISCVDGRATVICRTASELDLWDLATGDRVGALCTDVGTDPVSAVAVGRLDGRAIAAGCGDSGRVWIYDLSTREPLGAPLVHGTRASAVALGELGHRTIAVTAGDDLTVRLWDIRNRDELMRIDVGTTVRALAWDRNTCVIGADPGLLAIRIAAPSGTRYAATTW